MGYHQVMKYGHEVDVRNITKINHYRDALKQYQNKDSDVLNNIFKKDGDFYNMDFDVVVGNPPYNGDTYIDFVRFGFRKATKYVCMITPAKWQAKDNSKNKEFRRDIVPYMSKIVYYPDTGDVFNVRLQGGISYYLLNKSKNTNSPVLVKNVCRRVKYFNSTWESMSILNQKCVLYNNKIRAVIDKVGAFNKSFNQLDFGYTPNRVNVCSAMNTSDASGSNSFQMFGKDGQILMTTPFNIIYDGKYTDKIVFSSDSNDECESYVSYIDTKFVRFMFLMSYCRNTIDETGVWRFVPDPGPFDHIFTDEELYKKYNLTDNEIDLIESVIKDRTE